GWTVQTDGENADTGTAIAWFEARFDQALAELEDHYQKFRMSDALQLVYKLAWDDFCSWYLEMVKPEQGQPIDGETYEATVRHFENILKVLHPFMPFITEEIWQQLQERKPGESICVAPYPKVTKGSASSILADAAVALEAITQIRNLRNGKGLSPKVALPLKVRTGNPNLYQQFGGVIRKLANVSELESEPKTDVPTTTTTTFLVKSDEFFVPLQVNVDVEKEREKIQKDLEYQQGFRESVLKKLNNERFVSNAKEHVITAERQKLADAEAKIKALEESLRNLGG
ncbi:MAG: class I tRNA ligase family protein, partial [Cytophagales bacterium]|nr:class I tRNA ligase family protein [Cytophagales bacterium]